MAEQGPILGKLIEGEVGRDAIHIAIAPVTAGGRLLPGDHVKLDGRLMAVLCHKDDGIGIVDPFLTCGHIDKGQRFYLFLYPNTVTSLRHVWTHPAFKSKFPTEAP